MAIGHTHIYSLMHHMLESRYLTLMYRLSRSNNNIEDDSLTEHLNSIMFKIIIIIMITCSKLSTTGSMMYSCFLFFSCSATQSPGTSPTPSKIVLTRGVRNISNKGHELLHAKGQSYQVCVPSSPRPHWYTTSLKCILSW